LLTGSIAALLSFAAFVLLHIVVAHVGKPTSPFRMITRLYAISWAAGVGMAVAADTLGNSPQERLLAVLTAAMVSMALFVLYMPFYYTFAASLTLQTVLTLDRAGEDGVRLSDLYAAYASDQTLLARMDSMVASGNLVRAGLAYRLTRRGRLLACVFRVVKDLWQLGPGG